MRKALITAVGAVAMPGLVQASGGVESHQSGTAYLANGQFTYEVFEATVEHADLEGCPADFDTDAVFCRVTIASDLAHIFAFSYNGDQHLLAVKSYELTDGFLPF